MLELYRPSGFLLDTLPEGGISPLSNRPGGRAAQGDRLMLGQDGGEALELIPTEADTFIHMGARFTLEFERDQSGAVVALRVGSTRAARM